MTTNSEAVDDVLCPSFNVSVVKALGGNTTPAVDVDVIVDPSV